MNYEVTTRAEHQTPAVFVYHGYTGQDARQALDTEKKLGRILLWAAYISGFAAAITVSSWTVASFLVLTLLVGAALGQVGKPGDTTGFDQSGWLFRPVEVTERHLAWVSNRGIAKGLLILGAVVVACGILLG